MNAMHKLLALLILVLFAPAAALSAEETLTLNIYPESRTLVLQAISTGCTKKKDFEFAMNEHQMVTVTRLNPDLCRAKPQPIELVYSFVEAGIDMAKGLAVPADTPNKPARQWRQRFSEDSAMNTLSTQLLAALVEEIILDLEFAEDDEACFIEEISCCCDCQ